MQYIPFILFALIATTKAFLDTIVFRSGDGRSIFPKEYSPFISYNTTPLTLGLIRLDPYHKAVYLLIALIIGFAKTYQMYGPVFGYWDLAALCLIWGIFYEVPWRLFYRPK